MTAVRHEWDFPDIGLRKLSHLDRLRFWTGFEARDPQVRYEIGNTFARWRAVGGTDLNLSLYITNHSVGIFVRGLRGVSRNAIATRLEPREKDLVRRLGIPAVRAECPCLKDFRIATTDTATWPEAYDWLKEAEALYLKVFTPRRGRS